MKKIILCLVCCIACMSLSAQNYENSYVSMEIPDGWKVENVDVPGVNMEMLYFMNSGSSIYNIGSIIGIEQMQEPKFALENQMLNKSSNILFENAVFETIRLSSFMGKKAYTVDFSTHLFGEVFKGAAYAFNENECTLLAIGCYKVGTKSKLPQIWKSIRWKKHVRTKSTLTLREEIEEYVIAMNKLLAVNPIGTDEEKLVSFKLEENEDCLVYNYKLTEISVDQFNEEQITLMHDYVKLNIVPMLKQNAEQTELLKRCMDNNYVFKYIYLDKDDKFLYSVKVIPEDYKD